MEFMMYVREKQMTIQQRAPEEKKKYYSGSVIYGKWYNITQR